MPETAIEAVNRLKAEISAAAAIAEESISSFYVKDDGNKVVVQGVTADRNGAWSFSREAHYDPYPDSSMQSAIVPAPQKAPILDNPPMANVAPPVDPSTTPKETPKPKPQAPANNDEGGGILTTDSIEKVDG